MNKYTIISHGPVAGIHRLVLLRGTTIMHVAMAAHFQDAYKQLLRWI